MMIKENDLISRQEAIDALGEEPLVWNDDDYEMACRDQWQNDVDAIKAVPTVKSNRKAGKWLKLYGIKCSICGAYIRAIGTADMNYCPNCGHPMEGETKLNKLMSSTING